MCIRDRNGIFPVDDLTREYMKEHSKRPFTEYEADSDAEYDDCLLYTSSAEQEPDFLRQHSVQRQRQTSSVSRQFFVVCLLYTSRCV